MFEDKLFTYDLVVSDFESVFFGDDFSVFLSSLLCLSSCFSSVG